MKEAKIDKREVKQTDLQSRLQDTGRSPVRKYQEMAVGKRGIVSLIKYEIISFLSPVPGAIGFFFRKIFYKKLLGKVGRNVIFGRNIAIRHPHKIYIGDNVIIDDNCVLDAKGEANEGIRIGDNVMISRNTIIGCKEGSIYIGENTNIGINCLIHSESSVKIGANTLIAAYCYIVGGGSHDFSRIDIPVIQQGSVSKGIIMEDNLWLGAGVKVLDGVRIQRESVIGAGAVVTEDIPEFSIAVGMPARVVKKRKE